MKFLPLELVRTHMIPINIIYYDPYTNGNFNDPDILTIVYKDQDTNEKFVYEIKEPEIEIYIVKPEFRTYYHMRDMIEAKYCNKYKVKYRNRWKFISNKLKLNDKSEAKMNPYVFNADIQIETWYLIQFISEYPSNIPKTLSLGKLDIETDIIKYDGSFPGYGVPPINAVTYINIDTNDVYTLVLLKDDIPEVSRSNPSYEYFQNLKKHFYEQVDEIEKNPEIVLNKCHESFDEMYPGMIYNILYYKDEGQMLKDLMQIIHSTDNEFIGIWNSPFDVQNIISRPAHLGLDPREIIPDDRFSVKIISFQEDTNPVFHKRRHNSQTSTIPTFVDDMVQYSGIRSQEGTLPSHKLNYIAKKELKDEKYDYSEISDIVHLYYDNLLLFIIYNIKDVLLLVGLEKKTKDMENIYSRMYQLYVFPKEAFTTTKVVWHSLIKFMYDQGYVPGSNRNKGKNKKEIIDFSKIMREQYGLMSDEEEIDFIVDETNNESDEEESEGKKKEEKFPGALVLNTLHMKPTSVKIMGKPSKYVHDYMVDLDIKSEYPTAMSICNESNETLVGRVYLLNPDEIDVPIPEGFVFRGEDESKYKMNKSNFLLENYTENDIFNFCNLWLNLPSPEEVLNDIEKLI